ncbi:MAG: ABC transporter ATP-binding protein [Candidatus Geothermarchaeales archaeon]
MDLAISCRRLTKYYDGVLALDRLDLSVPAGELWGLVGPNGAGKTTTLRMLCGILRPTLGTAQIMGIDVSSSPEEAKSHIGYVPENPSLFRSLTVREYLTFAAELHSIPQSTFESNYSRYVSFFDLEGYEDQYIGSLSKGWLQRTTLCGVMLREPDVFLLDEPFYGLDPSGAYTLKKVLNEVLETGRTVLISTNMLDVTEKLCTHFTILNDGRVVAEGRLEELLEEADSDALEEALLRLTGRTIE